MNKIPLNKLKEFNMSDWQAYAPDILCALKDAKELIKKAERVCDEELLEEIKFHGYFPGGVVNPFSEWLDRFTEVPSA